MSHIQRVSTWFERVTGFLKLHIRLLTLIQLNEPGKNRDAPYIAMTVYAYRASYFSFLHPQSWMEISLQHDFLV